MGRVDLLQGIPIGQDRTYDSDPSCCHSFIDDSNSCSICSLFHGSSNSTLTILSRPHLRHPTLPTQTQIVLLSTRSLFPLHLSIFSQASLVSHRRCVFLAQSRSEEELDHSGPRADWVCDVVVGWQSRRMARRGLLFFPWTETLTVIWVR